MPTWICDAPIGSAVFVAAFGDDGSDVAVAEFDVLFAVAAAVVAEPAAALDVCTELAAVVVVDAAVVVGCNTVDRTAVVVDVVAAASEHNALDTVVAAAAVVVVAHRVFASTLRSGLPDRDTCRRWHLSPVRANRTCSEVH